MAKIGIELKNYKAHKEFELPVGDYDIVILNGDNMTGKSSVINGLIENINAKNMSNEPLARGETKGEKSFIVEDKNGEEIKIIHTFDKSNPKGTFYALKDGKKIGSVTKIRELMGEVNTYTVQQLFDMSKNTAGRRKIISEILMRCLTDDQTKRINEINKLIQKDGSLYVKRADINSEIDTINKIEPLTDEEKKLLEEEEKLTKELAELKSKIEYAKKALSITSGIKSCYTTESVGNLINVFTKREDLDFLGKPIGDSIFNFAKAQITFIEAMKNVNFDKFDAAIKIKISEREEEEKAINVKISNIENIKYKAKSLDNKERLKKLNAMLEETQKEMNDLAEEKDKILAKSNLPKGLKIEGESDFTYNGFDFNEADISESEGWLLIAELTIPIYDAKYYRMGNINAFSKKSLNKIVELAHKNGKSIFLERVVDEIEDVYVETIIHGLIETTETVQIDNKESIEPSEEQLEQSEHFEPTKEKTVSNEPENDLLDNVNFENESKAREENKPTPETESKQIKSEDINEDDIKSLGNLF
jgi:hypothetical protein